MVTFEIKAITPMRPTNLFYNYSTYSERKGIIRIFDKEKELLEFFGINEQQNLEMDLQTDEEYNEVLRRDNGEITLAESLASNASENDNK
eukprot:Awhi_evm1s14590